MLTMQSCQPKSQRARLGQHVVTDAHVQKMLHSRANVAESLLFGTSTGSGGGVIAFLGAHEQTRQTARRGHFYLHAVPLAVISETVGFVADGVLMPPLPRDLFKNVVHLRGGAREECLASGDARKLIQYSLAFHAERAAGVAAAQDADGVERDVRLFQQLAKLVEGVPGIVVLTVADEQ